MEIKATTKVYCIFGHPVSHSLSPAMHNSAFSALGLDCAYVAFDISPLEIGKAVQAVRTLGISGVNITIPHKESIIPYLDEIAPDAELTGAVNTVKNEGGRLYGHNTDVGGFLRAIREELGINPEGSKVFLAGAGGAARAVMSAFCMNGAKKIYVLNRTHDKALKLATDFGQRFGNVKIEPINSGDMKAIEAGLAKSDILVNSTSSGMDGREGLNLPLDKMKKTAAVYDLVYKPRETELVKEARGLGLKA
ncbi:MAG TPA: shikimate dehydrogenase, partial [Thermodesulfobacteriota bacterium]|nr:shikimate dehydrogenase [Thermodesulfobacteriota bacterium]